MKTIEETIKYLEDQIKQCDDLALVEEDQMDKDMWLDRSWHFTVVLDFINDDIQSRDTPYEWPS